MSKKLVIGILAHVDAGKTTLAENILYLTGSIRKLGRVDHKDAFLDTYAMERERGITIFSKQAEFIYQNMEVALLDTPGHVDFSPEMERTLQVLDYAILVINAADGVQGHIPTLWSLLKRYHIPVFLFVNKMDQVGADRGKLFTELQKRLDDKCIDFDERRDPSVFMDNIAMCEESVLEHFLEHGAIEEQKIARLIAERKVFPCYFGSALKSVGVEELLQGLLRYTVSPHYKAEFGAKIFKIARDPQGTRLTYMKITGGSLKVKMSLTNRNSKEINQDIARNVEIWEEKADQIRIYSGAGFQTITEAKAGTVCAVTGLSKTYAGEGLGIEEASDMPILEPVLNYRIELPPECDVYQMFLQLRKLEEEEPQLHLVWNETSNEMHAQLMGEVQTEILKRMIFERFQVSTEFSSGSIVYRETIQETVEGIGHFEPLRHYAEVHILLEPLEAGSGLQFDSDCSEDMLDRNWQRLILTHLEEKKHLGVLTGSEITDMRITLIAGRAHQKHTEGGDFRQATYRAVRQGLKKVQSILLEPIYEFRLELPTECVGRAMADVQKMYGNFQPPLVELDSTILSGTAPVATMQDYQSEVVAYTKGQGRLFCMLKGYEPCHNEEEVRQRIGYDSEKDIENPTGSVFCAHGAGFVVPWNQVEAYMHVDSIFNPEKEETLSIQTARQQIKSYDSMVDEKELEDIFTRTYGSVKRERNVWNRNTNHSFPAMEHEENVKKPNMKVKGEEYLLVDGYNIIFAWEELHAIAENNMEGARNKLIDILSNYQGYRKNIIILVFDAYRVKGSQRELSMHQNIHVVFTKEAETADQYIEKTVHEMAKKYQVTVATSDALEQMIVWGQGGNRLSARGLKEEIEVVNQEIRTSYLTKQKGGRNYLKDYFPDDSKGSSVL